MMMNIRRGLFAPILAALMFLPTAGLAARHADKETPPAAEDPVIWKTPAGPEEASAPGPKGRGSTPAATEEASAPGGEGHGAAAAGSGARTGEAYAVGAGTGEGGGTGAGEGYGAAAGEGAAPQPALEPAGRPQRIASDRYVLRYVPAFALTKPYWMDVRAQGLPARGGTEKSDFYVSYNQYAPVIFCIACVHMDENFYAANIRGNEEPVVQAAYGFAMMFADAARQKREGAGGGFSMETKDRAGLGDFAREFDSTVQEKGGDMREIALIVMKEPVMWMVIAYYPASAENMDALVQETLSSVALETLPGAGAKRV